MIDEKWRRAEKRCWVSRSVFNASDEFSAQPQRRGVTISFNEPRRPL